MKVFYVFLLVLVFGVVGSHGRTYENKADRKPITLFPPTAPSPYDELFLVQQWPASFCNATTTPCPSIPPYFTVHGLWAQKKSGHSVTCTGKTFDISKLHQNTELNMTKFWPNLNGKKDNKWFWAHEYDTHASCISPFQNDQDEYFLKTLQLATNNNVTTTLLKAGIQPGMTQYSISAIKKAIYRVIKVNPRLQCNKAKKDGTVQLFQIYLCFDKTASILKNCRKPDKDCPTQNANSLISFPHP